MCKQELTGYTCSHLFSSVHSRQVDTLRELGAGEQPHPRTPAPQTAVVVSMSAQAQELLYPCRPGELSMRTRMHALSRMITTCHTEHPKHD